MRRIVAGVCVSVATAGMVGCPAPPTNTTVRLVNSANFPVEVRLFYDDEQLIPEGLLEEVGQELNFTVAPGAVQSFSRDCNDLQAIVIQRADLQIIGNIGPSASTRVYRDGSDFGCGDTITFTFTQSITATDLDISFSR